MAVQIFQQMFQLLHMFRLVVKTGNQRIFKCNAVFGLLLIIAAGFHQFCQRPGIVHRHHAGALFIVWRMQRYSQHNIQFFIGQFMHFGHHTAGGYRHAANANLLTLRVVQQTDGFAHIVQVMQRFPHTHEYHIAHRQAVAFLLQQMVYLIHLA